MRVIEKKMIPAEVESVTVEFVSSRFLGIVKTTVRKAGPHDPDSYWRRPSDVAIVNHGDNRSNHVLTYSEAGARALLLALREYFGE
jgi:hypothetical protein